MAQAGVRFHFPLLELDIAPDVEFFHHRPAVLLVEVKPFFLRHTQRPRLLIVAINLA
jgi:hypothetical protein